jgi:hypothetical protein
MMANGILNIVSENSAVCMVGTEGLGLVYYRRLNFRECQQASERQVEDTSKEARFDTG